MWGDSRDPRSRATGGFRRNERAQSVVIGSILMFTLIIGLLGVMQLYVVPQQNSEVELKHDSTVKDDFSELHSGILNAVENKRSHTATFHLGVEYPARFILLNPTNPQDKLSTETVGPLDENVLDTDGTTTWHVGEDVCGLPAGTDTKQLVQQGNYNEIQDPGFYAYENSITHHSIDDSSGQRFIDPNQAFVEEQTIYLRPLVGEDISMSKVGSESIRFQTNETGRVSIDSGQILTLPTELSESQWEEIVEGTDLAVDDVRPGEVDLDVQEDHVLVCTAIGARTSPNTDPDPDAELGEGPGNESFINPIGEGALEYKGIARTVAGPNDFEIEYFSHNEPHDIEAVRVASSSETGSNGKKIELRKNGPGVEVTVAGSFEEPTSTWSWSTGETATVGMNEVSGPDGATLNPNTELTIQFRTSSGEILTYNFETP